MKEDTEKNVFDDDEPVYRDIVPPRMTRSEPRNSCVYCGGEIPKNHTTCQKCEGKKHEFTDDSFDDGFSGKDTKDIVISKAGVFCFLIALLLIALLIIDTIIFADAVKAINAANKLIELLGGGEKVSSAKEVVSYIFDLMWKIAVSLGVALLIVKSGRKKEKA